MSLTLTQAEDDVREQTAHRDDAVRLDQEQLRRHLNREYRKLRDRGWEPLPHDSPTR